MIEGGSSVFRLSDREIHSKIHNQLAGHVPGTYRLHALNELGQFRPLSRLLGVDPEGILYIGGSTGSLANRIGRVRVSIISAYRESDFAAYAHLDDYHDPGAHQTGRRIRYVKRFFEAFPFDRLGVTLEACTPGEEWKKENALLWQYQTQYGEAPPLNVQRGDRGPSS